MVATWFDPNAIRGDIESELARQFMPPAYSSAANYVEDSIVSLGGFVYSASAPVTGVSPPSPPWYKVGRVLKVYYENVESVISEEGGLRVAISWFGTRNESVGCDDGVLRSIDGTLTCWVFSPRNLGTSIGLVDGARLRRILNLWNSVSDCGKQIRTRAVSGPRATTPSPGADFYTHIVTCSLQAMERV